VKIFDADKTRMTGLPYGEKNYDNYVKPFSSNTGALRTDGQTDGRTEYLYQYIYILSVRPYDFIINKRSK